MKKGIFTIGLIFIILAFNLFFGVSVYATENTGSVKFIATTESEVIDGLEVAIYQVGFVKEGTFQYAEGFENCTYNENELINVISEIEECAKLNAEPMYKETTNEDGTFLLDNMELGTYLFVQNNKTEDVTVQTVLISIPTLSDENEIKYDLTINPKIETIAKEEETEINIEAKEEKTIPYAGTFDYLVPIITIAGIIIFLIAWVTNFKTNKKKIS